MRGMCLGYKFSHNRIYMKVTCSAMNQKITNSCLELTNKAKSCRAVHMTAARYSMRACCKDDIKDTKTLAHACPFLLIYKEPL